MHYDVFNGDADGILALVQLRTEEPINSTLITGVKRDIQLLQQVDISKAKSVTALDISMEKNMVELEQLLANHIPVFYADHHRFGTLPESTMLTAHINTSADTCTSLLINEYLKGKHHLWAIAAAFGDNLISVGQQYCVANQIPVQLSEKLQALGKYVNYNGYGRTVDDLHFHPANLFKQLLKWQSPLGLFDDKSSLFYNLEQAFHQDIYKANKASVLYQSNSCKVIMLDDEKWARRVSGVFGNELANQSPNKAHAVLTKNLDNSYTVSVRAPLNNKQGADEVCIQFPTGGGRTAAAGINELPEEKIETFISTLDNYYK